MMKKMILVAFNFLLISCVSQPYSVMEFSESDRADTNNYNVVMTGLDGKMKFNATSKNIEPGEHFVRIETTKKGRSNFSNSQYFSINAKPCVRYFITAQHESSLSTNNKDWNVRVLREEPIKHCEKLVAELAQK